MATPLVLVGGGEHARVVLDAALARPDCWQVLGFLDPAECRDTAAMFELPRLGGDEALPDLLANHPGVRFVLGIGGSRPSALRPQLVQRLDASGAWATITHPTAWVSPRARLGSGAVVLAGALVNAGATIGAHAIINTGAVIEHDVQVGAFSHISPGAVIGGGATIGEGSHLGLGCRVRDHVRIGAAVLVGMAAAVVADVPDGQTVVGVPAKPRP